MTKPYNTRDFNVGHSVFPGFNDRNGLVICGYEWGHSLKDQELENDPERYAAMQAHLAAIQTFHSKAWDSPYDRRISKWLDMWGHPLGYDGGLSAFDRAILQTNWCNDQGTHVSDYEKFLSEENVQNFLGIMREFTPSLLIFMGVRQIEYLQDERVKLPFQAIFGKEIEALRFARKDAYPGQQFRVGFQRFERISVVSLPHPSGSRGLSDDYIALFADEIGGMIAEFKRARSFS